MGKSLSKAATISRVAEAASKELGAEISKKETLAVIEALVALTFREAKNKFKIPGLGIFVLKAHKARMGRNPATNEAVAIKAKKVLKFRPSIQAREAVRGA